MGFAREGKRPTRLVVQDLTDPRITAPAVAWRGAADWFTHMGPGDTRLLVNWQIKPVNRRSKSLGDMHPQCAELTAGPGPNATAL
eukprot:1425135-Alexandrium_andersonii.AAC.1